MVKRGFLKFEYLVDGVIQKLSVLKISYVIGLCVISNLLLAAIFSVAFPEQENVLAKYSLKEQLFLGVVIAPNFETLICQYIIIEYSRNYFGKDCKAVAIFLSAALFGFAHYYSVLYIIIMFLVGILFGVLYFTALYKNKSGFLFVMMAHAIYNLVVILGNNFS